MSTREHHDWQRFIGDDISSPRVYIPTEDSSSSFRIRPVRSGSNRLKPVPTGKVKTIAANIFEAGRTAPSENELKPIGKHGRECSLAMVKPNVSKAAADGEVKVALKRNKVSRAKLTQFSLNLEDPFGASDEIVDFLEDRVDCKTVMRHLREMKRSEGAENALLDLPPPCSNTKSALPRSSGVVAGRFRPSSVRGSRIKPSLSEECTPEPTNTDHTILKTETTASVASVEQETTEEYTKVVKRVRFVDEKLGRLDQDSLKFMPRKPSVPKTKKANKPSRRTVILYPSEAAQIKRQDQLRRVQLKVNDAPLQEYRAMECRTTRKPSATQDAQVDKGNLVFSPTATMPHRVQITGSRYEQRPNSADDDSQYSSTDDDETRSIQAQSFSSPSRSRLCRDAAERARQRATVTRRELGLANGRVDGADARTGFAAQAWGRTLVRRRRQQSWAERQTDDPVFVYSPRDKSGRNGGESTTRSGCHSTECGRNDCSSTSDSDDTTNRHKAQTKPTHHHHHKRSCVRNKSRHQEDCSLDVSREDRTKETASSPSKQQQGTPLTIPFVPLQCDETFTLIMKRETLVKSEAGKAKTEEVSSSAVDEADSKDSRLSTAVPLERSPQANTCVTTEEQPQTYCQTVDSPEPPQGPSLVSEVKDLTTLTADESRDIKFESEISDGKKENRQNPSVKIPSPVDTSVDKAIALEDQQNGKDEMGPKDGGSGDVPTASVTCWEDTIGQDLTEDRQKKNKEETSKPNDPECDTECGDDDDVRDWLSTVGRKQTVKTAKKLVASSRTDRLKQTTTELNTVRGEHQLDNTQKKKLAAKNEGNPEPQVGHGDTLSEDTNEVASKGGSNDEFAFDIPPELDSTPPFPVKEEPVVLIPPPTEQVFISDLDDNVFDWFEESTSPKKTSTNSSGGAQFASSLGKNRSRITPLKESQHLHKPHEDEDKKISSQSESQKISEEAQETKHVEPDDATKQQEILDSSSGEQLSDDLSDLQVKTPLTAGPPERGDQDSRIDSVGTAFNASYEDPWATNVKLGQDKLSKVDSMKAAAVISDQSQKRDSKPNWKPGWLLSFSAANQEENVNSDRLDRSLSAEATKPTEPRSGRRRFQEDRRKGPSEKVAQVESGLQSPKSRETSQAARTTEKQKEDEDILDWFLGSSSPSSKSVYVPSVMKEKPDPSQGLVSRNRLTSSSLKREPTDILFSEDSKDRGRVSFGRRGGKADEGVADGGISFDMQPSSSIRTPSRRRHLQPKQALDCFLRDNLEATPAPQELRSPSPRVSEKVVRGGGPAGSLGNKVDKSSDWFDNLFPGSASSQTNKKLSAGSPSTSTLLAENNTEDFPVEDSEKKSSSGSRSKLSETDNSRGSPLKPEQKLNSTVTDFPAPQKPEAPTSHTTGTAKTQNLASSSDKKTEKTSDWLDDLFKGSSSTSAESKFLERSSSASTEPAAKIIDLLADDSAKKLSFGRRSTLPETTQSERTGQDQRREVPTLKSKGDVSDWLTGGTAKPRQERKQPLVGDDLIEEKEQKSGRRVLSHNESNQGSKNTSSASEKEEAASQGQGSTPSGSGSSNLDWLLGDTPPSPSNKPSFGRRSSRRMRTDMPSCPSASKLKDDSDSDSDWLGVISRTLADSNGRERQKSRREPESSLVDKTDPSDDWPEDILSGFVSKHRSQRSGSGPRM